MTAQPGPAGAGSERVRSVVGAPTAKILERDLGIETVADLIGHYPRRYAQRGQLTDLGQLAVNEHVTVLARVASATVHQMKQRRGSRLDVVVTDGQRSLSLVFFAQVGFHRKELQVGRQGLFSGKVTLFGGTRQLAHPAYELLPDDVDGDLADPHADPLAASFAARPIPIYPATASLASWRVAKCVAAALPRIPDLPDPVPAEVAARRGLVPRATALERIHVPRDWADVESARARLRFEEAFVLQAALALRRAEARSRPTAPRPGRAGGLLDAFDARLPFALTEGQRQVSAEIAADLGADLPMQRLLQGEVGSGKTVVALRAMLAVVDSGGQAALLAPTEVLAQQHHRAILALLGPLAERGLLGGSDEGTAVALLTGSMSTGQRRQALLDLASGAAGLVVGTHALLEDKVDFFDLGLVVVDEQHRFGVEQRDALRAKGRTPPHLLVMTATPIPRTVAMTVFGDLEVSTLTELPAGRTPIATHVVPALDKPHYLERAWQRVREEVARGRQAYVVCPRIGGGEPDDELEPVEDDEPASTRRPAAAVLEVGPALAEGPLAGLRVGLLHGRMAPEAKDAAMRDFAAGAIDVLVATTVIEVGVDVANATVMVVLDADRFGVSQLHQLRGRVGRGGHAGLALLVTEAPDASPARARLAAVEATLDGFVLARLDLEQRREGDVLGHSQSGRRSSLRLLSVLRDEAVIADARDEAFALVAADPTLAGHPGLAAELAEALGEERAEYLGKA